MTRVIVVDYDPRWPELFDALRAPIWRAVSDLALAIEHVGSTSVPGLAAKPVIDMDVVVRPAEVATCIERLTALGYEHLGDLGIPQREAFEPPAGSPPHHLYVCTEGSAGVANHLAVREYIRANASEARSYGELKKRLALEHTDDRDGYTIAKTDFLVAILRKAGISEQEVAEIDRLNR